MMNFRLIRAALIDLLTAKSTGEFMVVKTQRQTIGALELPRVLVRNETNNYPNKNESLQVERDSIISIEIAVSVSLPMQANLETLNDPSKSAQERSAALDKSLLASDRASEALSAVLEKIYQIIEDARNYDLGFPIGTVSGRHISAMNLNMPESHGSLVIADGSLNFECQTTEKVLGEEGIALETDKITGKVLPY